MAENKHTTLAQMEQSALRTRYEVLALLVAAFGGVLVGRTITLPVESWEGRAQTIKDEDFFVADSHYWYFVCPDADNYMEGSDTGIRGENVRKNGEMTIRCEIVPESDLIVNIFRVEVEI